MASQWIDVVDTALKIGLGASIAGIVAIIIPIINFAKETYADRRARRLKMIEESIILFQKYSSKELTFSSALADAYTLKIENKESDFKLNRYKNSVAEIDQMGDDFNKLISYLTLLGYHNLAAHIQQFSDHNEEAQKQIRDSTKVVEVAKIYDDLKLSCKIVNKTICVEFGRIYSAEPELKHIFYSSGPLDKIKEDDL